MTSVMITIADRVIADDSGPMKIEWKQYEQEVRDVFKEHQAGNVNEHDTLNALAELIGYHTGRGYPKLPERTP